MLGLAGWLRLTFLERLPVFVDEAVHLNWAQQFELGQTHYPWLMHGKLLLGVVVAQFQVAGPGALWLGRAAVALLSITGCAACLAIGKRLGPWPAGPLAATVYALLPLTVFHERQILADPLMASAGSIALAVCLRLARAPHWRGTISLALALATSILFKLTGLFYLGALVLSGLLLEYTGPQRRQRLLHCGGAALLAGALAAGLMLSLGPRAGTQVALESGESVGFLACPALLCGGDLTTQLAHSRKAASGLAAMVGHYVGWPLVALAALAWPLAKPARRRSVVLVTLFAAGILIAALLGASASLPPRYYLPLATPLIALAATSVVGLAHHLAARFTTPRWGWLVAGTVVLAVPFFTSTLPLMYTPETADMPPVDTEQYQTGDFAGTSFPEVAAAINARAAEDTAPGLILIDHHLPTSLAAYLNPLVLRPQSPAEVSWPQVTATLAAGGTVYVVDEIPAGSEPAPYPRLGGVRTLRLRIFDKATTQSLRPLYEAVFGQLEAFKPDYLALANDWSAGAGGRSLATYPPNQLAYVQALIKPQSHTQFIDIGGTQPWDPPTTIAALDTMTSSTPQLTVIYHDETRLDPQRTVETWLATHLFPISEQWIGPLRWVDYATGGAAQASTVNAHFGDDLVLEQIAVLDEPLQPGGLVRFALQWRATGSVTRPYKVFLHIFKGDTIVAQHDGQPVGELRPTNSWQPNEQLVDQFALRLPAELKPGDYQWRVGLYDLDTQARLPVRLADGTSAEFYTGGLLTLH